MSTTPAKITRERAVVEGQIGSMNRTARAVNGKRPGTRPSRPNLSNRHVWKPYPAPFYSPPKSGPTQSNG
jgi:hypothetical protein